VARASGTAGRAARAGRPAVTAPAQPTATAEDGESDAQPARTLDALRNTGDPNDVGRTPILGTDDIPVTPGEWPLGYPLQGVPRVAVTLSLQYVYNEVEDQWERDTGNGSGVAAGAGRAFQAAGTNQSVPEGSLTTVTLTDQEFENGVTVDVANDEIVIENSGRYVLAGEVSIGNISTEGPVNAKVVVNGSERSVGETYVDPNRLPQTGPQTSTTTVDELSAGDTVQLVAFQKTGSNQTLTGGPGETHLSVGRMP